MNIEMFDNMVPWERDIYLNMMIKEIEDENTKLKLAESAKRAAGAKTPQRQKFKRK
jgi:hypothetical protein